MLLAKPMGEKGDDDFSRFAANVNEELRRIRKKLGEIEMMVIDALDRVKTLEASENRRPVNRKAQSSRGLQYEPRYKKANTLTIPGTFRFATAKAWMIEFDYGDRVLEKFVPKSVAEIVEGKMEADEEVLVAIEDWWIAKEQLDELVAL